MINKTEWNRMMEGKLYNPYVYALSELFRVPIDKIICGNRGYQPEQRSIYYRLKAYVKYLQLYVEVTYEDVSLFSN